MIKNKILKFEDGIISNNNDLKIENNSVSLYRTYEEFIYKNVKFFKCYEVNDKLTLGQRLSPAFSKKNYIVKVEAYLKTEKLPTQKLYCRIKNNTTKEEEFCSIEPLVTGKNGEWVEFIFDKPLLYKETDEIIIAFDTNNSKSQNSYYIYCYDSDNLEGSDEFEKIDINKTITCYSEDNWNTITDFDHLSVLTLKVLASDKAKFGTITFKVDSEKESLYRLKTLQYKKEEDYDPYKIRKEDNVNYIIGLTDIICNIKNMNDEVIFENIQSGQDISSLDLSKEKVFKIEFIFKRREIENSTPILYNCNLESYDENEFKNTNISKTQKGKSICSKGDTLIYISNVNPLKCYIVLNITDKFSAMITDNTTLKITSADDATRLIDWQVIEFM